MPLIKGAKAKTKKGFSKNISIEKHAHPEMPIKQAVAIAYSQAGESKKKKPVSKESFKRAGSLMASKKR